MGLFDAIRGQFVDIIEWIDNGSSTMVYRFERHNNEIKYGAKLVVREGQAAVFINEGALADVFQPGTYTLETKNMPILSTLKGWKYGFSSPFKAEVYFVTTRRFTDLKWGTKNPIMMRDAEFGPVRLRAFGTFEIKVNDPALLIKEVVGTNGRFDMGDIHGQLRNMIITRFTDILGESKIPILDLAANYDEMSEFVFKRLSSEYEAYGIWITKFLVENISLPPAVEAALDKRSSMGVLGNMQNYTAFQMAESLPDMAKNQGGGLAAAGMGLGAGMHLAGQFANNMQPQQAAPAAAAPPPVAPPPMPPQLLYYAVVNGAQSGPFDTNALRQHIGSGAIGRSTLVWRQGMANWLAAGEVGDLQGFFVTPPPPPPMMPPPPIPQ